MSDIIITEEYIQLLEKANDTAYKIVHGFKERGLSLVLAESCTAGLVSSLIVNISGASDVLYGSFVCYTKEAKVSMLGLDCKKLEADGLVCRKTVSSMACGALQKSGAKISAAVTGFADTPSEEKGQAGTVWIAAAVKNGKITEKEFHFTGSRNEVRMKAAVSVLETVHHISVS